MSVVFQSSNDLKFECLGLESRLLKRLFSTQPDEHVRNVLPCERIYCLHRLEESRTLRRDLCFCRVDEVGVAQRDTKAASDL